jgi:hypothetical protein
MTAKDEVRVLLVLLAMAAALWLAAQVVAGPEADPEEPSPAQGGAVVAAALP